MPALQSANRPTLYLIDGSAYVYRAFFALPPLSNSKGLPTNAVYGFATMLMKILREHQPDFLAVAFDEKGPTIRHEEFEEYKAHRPEMPQGMQVQIPYIHRLVEAFGLPVLRLAGFEADDLIGTMAQKAEGHGLGVVIVTSDKDMFQLLTPSVRIYDPVKDKWFDETACRERFGVEPARVVEVMGLMGDATDNIPGVHGVGEKTARKLIAQFGTIEDLLSRLDEIPAPKTKALLKEQADKARLSRKLATIQVDCPLDFDESSLQVKPPPPEPLEKLLRELEFSTLLNTLQPGRGGEELLGTDVETMRGETAVREVLKRLSGRDPVAIFPVLSEPAGPRMKVEGFAVAAPDEKPGFFPSTTRLLSQALSDLLHDPTRTKAFHDLKKTLLAFGWGGSDVSGPYFDTMVADYLLNPNRRTHGLESIALESISYRMSAGWNQKDKSPPSDLFEDFDRVNAPKAAEAAEVILRVLPVLTARLTEQGSLRLFQDVEMPLVPVLAEIERNGFVLDVKALESLGKELDNELGRMMGAITRLAGQEFNINSPKQLAGVLFDKLGLTPVRKTKTGFSTDEDTLTQLATQHELPVQILNYRTLSKLKSTYVDALPTLVNPETRRLHTSLNQTVAATGRLSSTEPNLQNIPVKGEYGLRIREAFIAPPKHILVCADYSQIEPRILAHFSQDEGLLKVFKHGEDIHMATAVEIFNLVPERITREMRRIAKTVVFGILYGISPYGLSQTLGVTQQDAKKYIDAYFERYPGVREFLDRTIGEAKERGHTTTILGRRRPIPELQSSDQTQRSFGERMAVNSPIQGSAADLIKMAMIVVSRDLPSELPGTKMILQVHDELIFEVPEKDLDRAKLFAKTKMEAVGETLRLTVPLKVDVGVGPNWRAAHP